MEVRWSLPAAEDFFMTLVRNQRDSKKEIREKQSLFLYRANDRP